MIIPFVGGSYQMEAESFDNQRCVNLYPIASESGTSKTPSALRGTSGTELFTSVGTGLIRGSIEVNGRGFVVSGNEFYEVFADGTSTLRGTLLTTDTICTLKSNPTQIMIIDKSYGYIFNCTTDTFTQITSPNFPTPASLTFQDGFFIVAKADSLVIHVSNINDGTTWDALDQTTVEGLGRIVAVVSDSSSLWILGTVRSKVYQNTGATFPFQWIVGADIETGCAAVDTVQELDNSIYWLGSDANGDSIIWKNNGYNAMRVSTQAIEKKIEESTDFSESYAWTYHQRGHAFYMLQVKSLKTTICLDVSLNVFHERVYNNTTTGKEEQHRGSCHMFFKQKHIIGDRENGNLYNMALDIYSDNGNPIIRKRISPHYAGEKELISHAQFELDMQTGVGLVTGQGSDPKIMMRYSDDGGQTWSSELQRTLGAIGKTKTRVKWNKLGRSRERVYEVSVSDPVFVQINGAIFNGR